MFDFAPLLLAASLLGALGALPAWAVARFPARRPALGLGFALLALALVKTTALLGPLGGWAVHGLVGALGIGVVAALVASERVGPRGALPVAVAGLWAFGAVALGGFGFGRTFVVDLATRALVGLGRPLPAALREAFVDQAVALLDPSLSFALAHPFFVASTAAVLPAAALVLALPRVLPALRSELPGLSSLAMPRARWLAAGIVALLAASLLWDSLAVPADLALGLAAVEGLALCLLLRARLLGRALALLALLNWQALPLLAALGLVGWLIDARSLLPPAAPTWSPPRSPWLVVLVAAALAGSIRNCDGLMTSLPDPPVPTSQAGPAPEGMQRVAHGEFAFHMDADELPATGLTHAAAVSACAERGARLCTESEWFAACFAARPGQSAEDAGQLLIDRCSSQGPGPSEACVTPDGVRDLLGGRWEWVAPAADLPSGVLVLRGGSADAADGTRMQCDYRGLVHERWLPRIDRSSVGARCCDAR